MMNSVIKVVMSFVILFNDLENISHVHLLSEHIINNMTFTLPADRKGLLVTASIGIAIYPVDDDSEETLLRLADSTMYQAKKPGRRNYSIHSQNND